MQVSPVVQALEARVRTDGARPLLTWYGGDGARVELSVTTFANWADKASNLLGELGWDDHPLVGIPLLVDHPAHWMGWVWTMATWQVGGHLEVAQRTELGLVDVSVLGPEHPCPVPGSDTIACSLHPLGLGFPTAPPGVIDAHDVVAQPDVHHTSPIESDALALTCSGQVWSHDGLGAVATNDRRLLVRSPDLCDLVELFAGTILGSGSLVLVEDGVDDLDRIARDERAVPTTEV